MTSEFMNEKNSLTHSKVKVVRRTATEPETARRVREREERLNVEKRAAAALRAALRV